MWPATVTVEPRWPRPTRRVPAATWLARLLVLVASTACSGAGSDDGAAADTQAATDAQNQDAAGADASGTDVASGSNTATGSDAADAAEDSAIDPQDAAALALLQQLRGASESLATLPWPATAAWPAFALHQAPIFAFAVDVKGTPKRGYRLGGTMPADALPGPGAMPSVWRWDAGVSGVWVGLDGASDLEIAGQSLLVVRLPGPTDPSGPQADAAFGQRLVATYMTRLRELEAGWVAVQACGQGFYPRISEGIALLHLEAAVLSEALTVTEDAGRKELLRDWVAVHAAALATSSLLGQRYRHYDNTFASEAFSAVRVLAHAQGEGDVAARIRAAHQAALTVPGSVAIDGFDDAMFENGDVAAAALELAASVGIDAAAEYEASETIHAVLQKALGPVEPARVEQAKARHPWSDFLARAETIAALPAGSPFDP